MIFRRIAEIRGGMAKPERLTPGSDLRIRTGSPGNRNPQEQTTSTMSNDSFKYRLLVVDDDPGVIATSKLILCAEGYEVHLANNGFEALATLRGSLPDIIISDLAMPHMSGFELLSVIRRRFPHIPVIAISGQYDGNRPVGLLCDAYFVKAQYKPEDLFLKIGDLIKESPLRPHTGKSNYAPVWYPFS